VRTPKRPGPRAAGSGPDMVEVEVDNRSGVEIEADAAADLARHVLAAEGIEEGELGIAFVGADESRALKREHLGIDEATDVLSFPIDGREKLPQGLPRQLGDVVLCPAVVGGSWRRPLAHGLLHLLGYDHGSEMEAREEAYAA
jgi:probable rRNA maturation factor